MDDYLGLEGERFPRGSVTVFTGRSGSGKTTYLDWLLNAHPSFSDERAVRLYLPEVDKTPDLRFAEVLAVDEVMTVTQWRTVLGWRRRDLTVLSTAHLPAAALRVLCPSARVFACDRDAGKLARYLAVRGVSASPSVLQQYVHRFGATYTDLDLILEAADWPPSFDEAWRWFSRFGEIASTSHQR